MNHRDIIEKLETRLGGQTKLGGHFCVAGSTICHWKADGIPARHWSMVLALAKRTKLRLSLDDIVSHSMFAPWRMEKRPYRPNPRARNIDRRKTRNRRSS